MVLQVGCEQGLSERRGDCVEKGFLRDWLDSVDGAESKTKQTIGCSVRSEFGRNGGCCLDCLRSGCCLLYTSDAADE